MRVKNHMAMWILWFLWFLCVRYSGNPLYKPFCAFLVFVDLVWFLCGSFCGFWSRVVFWIWSARPIVLMWFLALVCASDRAHVVFAARWSCPRCQCRCASTCSLWSDKKICSLPRFMLCSISSPLGATFTNGENDHG